MKPREQYADYLDSKGRKPNYINGKPYSDAYHQFAKMWSELPLYKEQEKV